MEVLVLMGLVQNQEELINPQLGGNVEQQEVWSPSNLVGGGDDIGLEDQSGEQAKQLGEDVQENPVERLNIGVGLTTEVETGAALDATTVEFEDDRSMITK